MQAGDPGVAVSTGRSRSGEPRERLAQPGEVEPGKGPCEPRPQARRARKSNDSTAGSVVPSAAATAS